jgi:hypothetical protein
MANHNVGFVSNEEVHIEAEKQRLTEYAYRCSQDRGIPIKDALWTHDGEEAFKRRAERFSFSVGEMSYGDWFQRIALGNQDGLSKAKNAARIQKLVSDAVKG